MCEKLLLSRSFVGLGVKLLKKGVTIHTYEYMVHVHRVTYHASI